MAESDIQIGDHVRVYLDSPYWKLTGWVSGVVVKLQPYSAHRSFYWIELDAPIEAVQGGSTRRLSVLNPKSIRKLTQD